MTERVWVRPFWIRRIPVRPRRTRCVYPATQVSPLMQNLWDMIYIFCAPEDNGRTWTAHLVVYLFRFVALWRVHIANGSLMSIKKIIPFSCAPPRTVFVCIPWDLPSSSVQNERKRRREKKMKLAR